MWWGQWQAKRKTKRKRKKRGKKETRTLYATPGLLGEDKTHKVLSTEPGI